MEEGSLDDIIEKVERLRNIVKDNGEAAEIVDYLESLLNDPERLTTICIRKMSREKSERELSLIVDRMKKDRGVKRFVDIAKYPWSTNRTVRTLIQGLWIATAAISFMMGVYLFFPPYMFFGTAHGNATITLQRTLKLISENPQVLLAIDPFFKIMGFVMMAIAIVSLYQVHLISTYAREE